MTPASLQNQGLQPIAPFRLAPDPASAPPCVGADLAATAFPATTSPPPLVGAA